MERHSTPYQEGRITENTEIRSQTRKKESKYFTPIVVFSLGLLAGAALNNYYHMRRNECDQDGIDKDNHISQVDTTMYEGQKEEASTITSGILIAPEKNLSEFPEVNKKEEEEIDPGPSYTNQGACPSQFGELSLESDQVLNRFGLSDISSDFEKLHDIGFINEDKLNMNYVNPQRK